MKSETVLYDALRMMRACDMLLLQSKAICDHGIISPSDEQNKNVSVF